MNLKVKLMDGYTLLKRIEKYAKENDWFDDELDIIREFINAAPELDLSMWNGWTVIDNNPINLPDHDGEYLVTTVNDCGTRRRQVSSFVLFNGGMCYSWGIETSPIYKVLAWTELPEMWEG